MKTSRYIVVIAAAALLGGFIGALVTVVPRLGRYADPSVQVIIDIAAAVIAGVAFVGYVKFVRWLQRHSND